MLRALVLVCVLVAAITSGCGSSAGDTRDQALLASVLHGMKTDLRTVRLTKLTPDWGNGGQHGALELKTTTSASPTAHTPFIRANWDTLLIAHAYNEQCVRAAAHCLAVALGPSGGGREGTSGVRRPFWSAHRLAQEIRRRFAAAGLDVSSIAFEHPYALAPIVTVRSSHPQRALAAERQAEVALLPALRHSEGGFIQMFDARGRLFYVAAWSGNTSTGFCAPWLHCPAAA